MKKSLHQIAIVAAAITANIASAQNSAPAQPPDAAPQSPGYSSQRGDEPKRPPQPPLDPDRRDDARPAPPEDRDFRPGEINRGGDRSEFPGRQALRDGLRNGPPIPATPQPYVGVITRPLDPALTAQLGFTPGLGVIVEEVIPDGPAEKAGVQPLDVVKQINDQLISNPEHLAALARHFGKDADVTLVVVRKGQEQKLPLKIGERMMREPAFSRPQNLPEIGQPFLRRRGNDDPLRPPRDARENAGFPPRPSADLLREIGPGGPPEVQSFQDRASTSWKTSSAKVTLKDATGEIEIRTENGKRSMTAKNPKGETVFDGPIDTAEQREKIPAEFGKMLDQVEHRGARGGGPRADLRRPPVDPF